MLVQVHAVEFTFFRDTEQCPGCVHRIHHRQTTKVAMTTALSDRLGNEYLRSTTVEQALNRSVSCRAVRPGAPNLPKQTESQRERSPDAAKAVHRDRADGIVNAQPLSSSTPSTTSDAGRASQQRNRAGRALPTATDR